ncbi:ets DNA-binding protein pokkuri [Cylas formicarius]|uniref:ets DNA-binding protein pokkuri n=1 Tax=Cylas formicarius TaxID=197179 RepID=UPI00295889FE|nr:ets DNA-binding protein pokkuri [Cylas formicarius]XP_060531739.1 ets DNA-binding protein pokkuri [Cylas formicarius]
MKLVPGPLPPIPTSTSTSGPMDRLPLPLPFSPDLLWRYPLTFPAVGGHPSSPLWDYKSQLPASLASDPRVWSRDDVVTFIRWAEREFDLQPIDMDMFQMNGKAVCLLTRTDLAERAPGSGDVLHNVLQILVREANNLQRILPNSPITPTSRHPYPLSPHTTQPPTPTWNLVAQGDSASFHSSHAASLAAHIMAQSNSVTLSPAPSLDSQSGSPQHADLPQTFGHSIFNSANGSGSNGSGSNPSDSDEDPMDSKTGYVGSPPSTPGYVGMSPMSLLTPRSPKLESVSSPGLYKREFFAGESPEPNTNGRLLWDFLQQLLNDPSQRYTSYIAWKNRETGVFKIVDPAGLAKLWGIQKNHLSMNYDKMSRALRYYYRVNILRKVQGERHCYQFLRNPTELKNIKNISLLRQQMSPTSTKPPQMQLMAAIKPEPVESSIRVTEVSEAVASRLKLPEPSHHQLEMKVESSYDESPTDLSVDDGPTDLSSTSRHVNIVCSPDPPIAH